VSHKDPAPAKDAFELKLIQLLVVKHPKRQCPRLDLPFDSDKPLIY
jgi:hypothetical protein